MVTGTVIYPFQVLRDAVGGEGATGYFSLDIYNSFVTYLTASNIVSPDIADDYPELDPYVLGTVGQNATDSSSWYNHVVDYQPGQNLWLFPVDFRMHLPTQADRLDVLAARNPRTGKPQALGYFSTSRDLNRDGQPEGALIDWSTMGDLLTAASIVDYMRTYTESGQTFGYSVRAYNAGLINQAAAF